MASGITVILNFVKIYREYYDLKGGHTHTHTHTHTHSEGLPWTSDRSVAEASIYTTQETQETFMSPARFEGANLKIEGLSTYALTPRPP